LIWIDSLGIFVLPLSMILQKVSHTMFYVNDLNRAVAWYTEKLGCKVNFQSGSHYASLQMVELNYRIDLHPSEAGSKDVGFGPILYFASNKFDQAVEGLKSRGIKVGEPRTEGSHRFVTFWDSEGNALGIEECK
jgi:catechol 2,3-dioxygenase-like lactoylglutathione lyase family enzyme